MFFLVHAANDSSFKFGQMDDPEKYICVFTGFIKVATEGYHILGSASWGGTKIYLGRLEHILKQSQQKMELAWVLPDGVVRDEDPKAIPWSAFYGPKE